MCHWRCCALVPVSSWFRFNFASSCSFWLPSSWQNCLVLEDSCSLLRLTEWWRHSSHLPMKIPPTLKFHCYITTHLMGRRCCFVCLSRKQAFSIFEFSLFQKVFRFRSNILWSFFAIHLTTCQSAIPWTKISGPLRVSCESSHLSWQPRSGASIPRWCSGCPQIDDCSRRCFE